MPVERTGLQGSGQMPLQGMPRRLYPCTPARLTSWLDCPRRYRMSYLDRPTPPKGPPWAHNSMGASVHAAMAAWWRQPVERRTPGSAAGLVEKMWSDEGFRDAEQSSQFRRRAVSMVETYVAHLDPADEPAGVERVVSARTETLTFTGRVDRIDLRVRDSSADEPSPDDQPTGTGEPVGAEEPAGADEVVVVDYKTGRRPLSDEDARTSLALALYALAAGRVLRRPSHLVELHHLPTGAVASWRHGDEGLERHLRRAESLAAECRDADAAYRDGLSPDEVDRVFPPVPGAQCGWCDFVRQCPAGLATGQPRRSWEGLAAPA